MFTDILKLETLTNISINLPSVLAFVNGYSNETFNILKFTSNLRPKKSKWISTKPSGKCTLFQSSVA